MRKLFSIALITIGSFLEVWYYSFRFHSDGIATWLAWTIGSALTLLLSLLVLIRGKRWAWFLIVPVAAYSIMATSAGQSFSLNQLLQTESIQQAQEAMRQDQIDELTAQIKRIDAEYDQITQAISATAVTLEDRGRWRTTLTAAEDRQRELTDQRKQLTDQLATIRAEATTHTGVEQHTTNIYEFYHGLFGWNARWLQFILQTVLSAFIALMAPIGIVTYPGMSRDDGRLQVDANAESVVDNMETEYDERQIIAAPEPSPQPSPPTSPPDPQPEIDFPDPDDDPGEIDWDQVVKDFVRICWYGKNTGKSNYIILRKTFDTIVKTRKLGITDEQYLTVLHAAQKAKVIDDRLIIVDNMTEARKKIMEVING